MFVFLGVHFTAFGALEHVTNAVIVCMAETQSWSCVLSAFCILSLNFHWSKSGMSCSAAVMYSVCKPDILETSKSEPVYAVLAIVCSEHTRQSIWKKLAHCRVLFISQNVHHEQPQQVMDFSLFLLPFTCCGIIFLQQHTGTCEQHNKENSLPFSWHADSKKVTLPQLISGFKRSVNEICFLLGFCAASIGSFLPTFRDNSWWWWNSHSGVGEDSSHPRRFALPIFYLQGQQPKMKAQRSTETSVTLHQLTERNLHQHLCENVMSHRIEDRARPSCCVWRVFYRSVKITASFTKAPYWTYFPFRILWYIKTLVNPNKCTILQSMYSFCYM